LCSFDGIELNIYREEQGYKKRGIGSHLVVDKNNKLWIGGFAGLVSFDGRYFTQELPELAYDKTELSVSNLGVDPDNNIIIGLNYLGFVLYNQVNYNVITKNMGLFYSPNCYFPLGNGRHLYGTTGQGIFYFDRERIVNISVKQGLCNNYVCHIGRDGDGHFWILTDNGINKIDQKELFDFVENKSPSLPMVTLNSRDGYFSNSSYDRAGIIQVGDDLWQNNQQCISIVNTKKLNEITYSPKVEITEVTINEEAYLFDVDSVFNGINFDDVFPFTRVPKSLKVDYNNNHLAFQFSAPDLDNPHQVQIAYRIKELNENWSLAGSERMADFRNLPPGHFTLEVKAKSLANKWSNPTIYPFKVLPPWYRTIWAYLAYFLATILIVWRLIKWQTNRYKRENINLEKKVAERTAEVVSEKNRSEELLLNILPEEVAQELKEKGAADAQLIDHVTVIFTDFKGFTSMSEKLSPKELVADLHACFSEFDRICEQHGIEKIKTIGDAYMAAGGLPTPNQTHPTDVVKAALEMAEVVKRGKAEKKAANLPFFEVRIGVHTGPVVAGIVGVKKFQYDIWGDTVNTASRMESSGQVGKVNISQATYDLLKDDTHFTFESRGKIEAKGKGEMEMYFVSKA
jgi:class 3 adenylate cyclase